jgi:hypothetical protein
MMRYLPAAVAVFTIAACAPSGYEPYLTRGLEPASPQERDRFTLERTACFGTCPVYTVTVGERDILQFQGKRFVAEEGGVVGERRPEGSFKELVKIAKSYEFSSFDTAYPNDAVSNCPQYATDMPSIKITFESSALTHAVSVYQGCGGFEGRARFDEMVAAMETVLDIDDLIGPREDFDDDANVEPLDPGL